MTSSRLIFGPDLEPIESESRRGAHSPGPRRDSLVVTGTSGEVVAKLVEATASTSGWCELQEMLPDDRHRTVYVNAHAVRWIVEEDASPVHRIAGIAGARMLTPPASSRAEVANPGGSQVAR